MNGNAGSLVSAAAQGIVASVVRTVVPLVYSVLIVAATGIDFPLDTGLAQGAALAITTSAVAYLWYLLGRAAETLGSSKLGWLFLGFAAAPIYDTTRPGILPGLVRTFVPYAAGAIIVTLARIDVVVDNTTVEAFVTGAISGAISVGWYLVGRLGETFWTSKAGILLGWLKPPTYQVQTQQATMTTLVVNAQSGDTEAVVAAAEVATIGGPRHARVELV